MSRKKIFISVIFILLTINKIFSQDYVSLNEAIENKKVSCTLSVNENGTHYTIQFIMQIKNLTNKDIKVIVETGLLFNSIEVPYQDFINTKEEKIEILAYQSEDVEIHAMCIENYNSAPTIYNTYTVGKMAEGSLLELAQLINKKKWYEKSEAQDAVWSIANGSAIENIIGPDDSIVKELHEFVSNAKGVPLPVEEELNTYETDYYHSEFSRKVSGYFEYDISKTSTISIAMFDENNILVRQLFYSENESSGSHRFDFSFDATVYTDDLYYFKLIENGIVKLQIDWDMR